MTFYPKIAFLSTDGRPHLYLLQEALFFGQYMGGLGGNNAEPWGFYNVFDFELPSEEDLKHIQTIIIPGSIASAADGEKSNSWIDPLIKFIQKVYNGYPNINILGVCFGSQIIARALGGTVTTQEAFLGGVSPKKNLFIGVERI